MGENEIEISPSTSLPNDPSALRNSSEGGTSTHFELYVGVTRFFAETMQGDEGGGEELGGAVLGELFKEVIRGAVTHFGHSRQSFKLLSNR